jgi:protein SCO1
MARGERSGRIEIGCLRCSARLSVLPVMERLVSRPLLWILALAIPFAWPIVWPLATPLPPPLLHRVPALELLDEGGHPFGTTELRGKIRLAGFIFRRCASPRPAITAPEIRQVVVKGLKAGFDRDGSAPGGISHDAHLVLVDGGGRLRGVYDSSEPDAVDRVVRDVGLLVNRGA